MSREYKVNRSKDGKEYTESFKLEDNFLSLEVEEDEWVELGEMEETEVKEFLQSVYSPELSYQNVKIEEV